MANEVWTYGFKREFSVWQRLRRSQIALRIQVKAHWAHPLRDTDEGYALNLSELLGL
jgi:hypothetical protein